MTPRTDLVCDVAHFKRMGMHTRFSHKSADAGYTKQHTFFSQLPKCAIRRHARNIQLAHQLVLRRHALARAKRAVRDLAEHVLLNVQIARGSGQWLGHPMSFAPCTYPCLDRAEPGTWAAPLIRCSTASPLWVECAPPRASAAVDGVGQNPHRELRRAPRGAFLFSGGPFGPIFVCSGG